MIKADFYRSSEGRLLGFEISGHAGLADEGQDVCCASVSSAVMLAANTITEAFKIGAKVSVEENDIMLKLGNDPKGEGDKVLLGLLTHLYLMQDEFPGYVMVKVHDR
ncbi:MAG: ribosomal-processing cysteine protease Prp [Ruminococcus sp.]|nr:ribosomal-processing cysteine protease Prp [Ruminococcus sp.]